MPVNSAPVSANVFGSRTWPVWGRGGLRGGSAWPIPKGLKSSSPRVARNELPWDRVPTTRINPERVESRGRNRHAPVMAQSLAKILVHTVFSTKERRPFLRDAALREETHRYLG